MVPSFLQAMTLRISCAAAQQVRCKLASPAREVPLAALLLACVLLIGCGGGSPPPTVNPPPPPPNPNPVPTVSSVAPATITVGSADTQIAVRGSGFVPASGVSFKGTTLSTTWVSDTQLTAVVPAALLAATASAPIFVQNPAPGGGTSSSSGYFASLAPMSRARWSPTATLLNNGKVLIVGGDSRPDAAAELYDPVANSYTPAGPMTVANRDRHTATLLKNGEVLIAGGFSARDLAEIYDPAANTFSPAGKLVVGRYSHTATLLNDGKVLLTGGEGPLDLDSAEIYDPDTHTFTATQSMDQPRTGHTATLLSDGRVLIVGGYNSHWISPYPHDIAESLLFDPVTGKFLPGPSLNTPRSEHSVAVMSGGKLLVTGGIRCIICGSTPLRATETVAELLAPETGAFTVVGNMGVPRERASSTLLNDGRILVAGGARANTVAELFDPATGRFTATASMNAARSGMAAVKLADGNVLFFGGGSTDDSSGAEIYRPETSAGAVRLMVINPVPTVSSTTPSAFPASRLASFEIDLLTINGGGFGPDTYITANHIPILIFQRSANQLKARMVNIANSYDIRVVNPPPGGGQVTQEAAVKVLLEIKPSLPRWLPNAQNSVQVFGAGGDPGTWTVREPASGIWLLPPVVSPDGSIVRRVVTPASAGIYHVDVQVNSDPGQTVTATLDVSADAPTTRTLGGLKSWRHAQSSSTLLADGRVLVVGGIYEDRGSGKIYADTAEVYDPVTNSSSSVVSALQPVVANHITKRLVDGRVLIAGGCREPYSGTVCSVDAFLYDPVTGLFTPTGSMGVSHDVKSRMILLPTSEVMVIGPDAAAQGCPAVVAEVYDPVAGTWRSAGPTLIPRCAASASSLPDGRVLLAGGLDPQDGHALTSTEIYNSATHSFVAGPNLNLARSCISSTTLADGRVLISGGAPQAELYDAAANGFALLNNAAASPCKHALALPDGNAIFDSGLYDVASLLFDVARADFVQVASLQSAVDSSTVINTGAVLGPRANEMVAWFDRSAAFYSNPVPTITSATTAFVRVSPRGVDLDVNGAGFVPLATVFLDDIPFPTTFFGDPPLGVDASATTAGRTYQVRVLNPGPVGGMSNSVPWTAP